GRAGREGVAITLITPKDYRQLRTIERLTHTKLKRMKLPSVADLNEHWQMGVIDRLRQTIDSGELGVYHDILKKISKEYTEMDVAAAALKLSLGLDEAEEPAKSTKFGSTGAKQGMTRLFFTVGRQEEISPPELKKIIAAEAGIEGTSIGNIDIYDKFSFVEVSEDLADCVINSLDKQVIKGRRAAVQPARYRR
ncbi:DEAD/DEAH box helicase, partial [Thermodesulfovibrionales bacterium]|nr:DEAD/DEAH box helicase [Thermodesulfovibrionales bacterium]